MAAKELVYDAVLRRATDIHLEPTTEQLSVRYRIDGILHAAEPFDRPTGDAVVNVFKVLSAMDISEKRKPQDGSFGAKLEGREPRLPRRHLGLEGGREAGHANPRQRGGRRQARRPGDAAQARRARSAASSPSRTGCSSAAGRPARARSTTLYACLREIDRFQKNIITVEDPIEYHLDNITQMEINTKSGQTFAGSLRSILRQDPDVIMIGEIRDQETAIDRLPGGDHRPHGLLDRPLQRHGDGPVPPARPGRRAVHDRLGALTAVLGQRLVRLLCEACKEPYKPKPEFLKKANLPADKVDVFYRRPENPEQVCQQCGGTGYLGRTGIFELLVLTEPMRDMIRENPSINAIKAEARKNGMIYLQEDGLRQVIQGRTSIDELLRVVK